MLPPEGNSWGEGPVQTDITKRVGLPSTPSGPVSSWLCQHTALGDSLQRVASWFGGTPLWLPTGAKEFVRQWGPLETAELGK